MSAKPLLSSRLMGLKFMQRAKEKEVKQQKEEEVQEQEAEVSPVQRARQMLPEFWRGKRGPAMSMSLIGSRLGLLQAQWVIEGARTRCIVIAEGDPPPSTSGGAVGRMSFGGYSAVADPIQTTAANSERQAATGAAEAANPGGKSVSDEAMAASLSKQKHRHSDGSRHSRQQDGSSGKGKKKRRGDNGEEERGNTKKQSRGRYF